MSTTRTVARNSLWYGLELAFVTMASMVTSILVARHFGPERLGDYSLVLWLTYVAGTLGSVGIPLTTRKYMAEFLGRGDEGTAYRIFRTALETQVVVATAVTLLATVVVWMMSPPLFRPVAVCMAFGILPRLIGFIPSQANGAAENAAANVPGSVTGGMVQVAFVLATLLFGWDLLGLAVAQVAGNTVEMCVKLLPVARKAYGRALPPLTAQLRSRMLRFSSQGLGLVLLSLLVFDRADLVMVKALQSDPSQITFYSLSFTLLDRLLLLPQTLSAAINASLMAVYGRDRSRVSGMTGLSVTYLLLVGLPVLGGAIAVSEPLWKLYGERYGAAVPIFATMAAFGVGRLLTIPAQAMLQVTENQGYVLLWSTVCAVVNLTLDLLLIPRMGAMGAAIGNGCCHALMAAGLWYRVWTKFQVHPQAATLLRIGLSAVVMALCAALCTQRLPSLQGVATAVLCGIVVYPVMLRLTGALAAGDRDRLLGLAGSLPRLLRTPFERLLLTLIPEYR